MSVFVCFCNVLLVVIYNRNQFNQPAKSGIIAPMHRHIGSTPHVYAGRVPPHEAVIARTPSYAGAGRTAEQSASGGGSASNAYAGQAAERLAGGGFAYTERVAAEQPTFGGLQAGDYPSNQDTAETAQARRAGTALRQPGGGQRPAQRDASYDIDHFWPVNTIV